MRFEMQRQAAVLDSGGRVVQETRHWHEDTGVTTSGPQQGARRRTTATSPSPTWCRSRRTPAWVEELRGDPAGAAGACAAGGCRPPGASRDFEMQSVLNAGALDLIEATVAAGADPAAARKWWLGELARIANERGVELGELPISPATSPA